MLALLFDYMVSDNIQTFVCCLLLCMYIYCSQQGSYICTSDSRTTPGITQLLHSKLHWGWQVCVMIILHQLYEDLLIHICGCISETCWHWMMWMHICCQTCGRKSVILFCLQQTTSHVHDECRSDRCAIKQEDTSVMLGGSREDGLL